MKMHKTILTLLAVMLAVIGTTGTVAYAEGPDTNDEGQSPDNLNPEQVLTGDNLEKWNSLTSAYQTILIEEIILEIPQRISDPTLHTGVLAGLVGAMHKIQEKRAARSLRSSIKMNPHSGGAVVKTSYTVDCDFEVDVNAGGASGLMVCDAEMHKIIVSVQLAIEASDYLLGSDRQTCTGCSVEWATVAQAASNPCVTWHGSGNSTPTGYTGGAQPNQWNYSDEDTYC